MERNKRPRLIAYDDESWTEPPISMTVHATDDDDEPPTIIVPDHDAGGWRAHRVSPSKPRMGFLP